jgi:hypothetical protein
MLSADTHRLARLAAGLGLNDRMRLATLLAACFFGAAAIPGIEVDSPADGREPFRKLAQQTNVRAEKGDVVVGTVASTLPACTSPTLTHTVAKDAKPTTPSQQMVRHNCASARAILQLTRAQ